MAAPDPAPRLVARMLEAHDVQGAGVVQGGIVAGVIGDVVATLAEELAGPAGRAELETLDVAFERPALPGSVTIVATLQRHGRSLIGWDARLVDAAGKTVATARSTHRIERP